MLAAPLVAVVWLVVCAVWPAFVRLAHALVRLGADEPRSALALDRSRSTALETQPSARRTEWSDADGAFAGPMSEPTVRLPRLLLRGTLALWGAAALLGLAALAADASLRFDGQWTGGYYDDPGAQAHDVFVWLALAARSISLVAVGGLAALALWQPRSLRWRLAWLWLALPAAFAFAASASWLRDVWPIDDPVGVHSACYADMGHPCPNYPLVPEAWVRFQLGWSVAFLTAVPSLLALFLAQVVGTIVRGTLFLLRWLRSRGERTGRPARRARPGHERPAAATSRA